MDALSKSAAGSIFGGLVIFIAAVSLPLWAAIVTGLVVGALLFFGSAIIRTLRTIILTAFNAVRELLNKPSTDAIQGLRSRLDGLESRVTSMQMRLTEDEPTSAEPPGADAASAIGENDD